MKPTDTLTVEEVDDATTTVAEVVPESEPVPKLRQVVAHGDAKALFRAFKELAKVDVGFMAICLDCQRNKRPEIAQWGRSAASGELALECGCTVRFMQGVTR